MPSLRNLNQDSLLDSALIYLLRPGMSTLGCNEEETNTHFSMGGEGIEEDHCDFDFDEDTRTIKMTPKAGLCHVNGKPIHETMTIAHGDRLILGVSHVFVLFEPEAAACAHAKRNSSAIAGSRQADWESAQEELCNAANDPRVTAGLSAAAKAAMNESSVRLAVEKHRGERLDKLLTQSLADLHRVSTERDTLQREMDQKKGKKVDPAKPLKQIIEERKDQVKVAKAMSVGTEGGKNKSSACLLS